MHIWQAQTVDCRLSPSVFGLPDMKKAVLITERGSHTFEEQRAEPGAVLGQKPALYPN